ncbi:MFS transporter [Qipengyuania qiaonensis]|uniref:MFS transporter n=1 Tax=Qipengyuania qiaonensis TaxID=2867240 RepID=A0ABS7J6P6_9SPHN|nr:MFS transporter [Qipengyuania qiaonensis]MBX7482613.1 MFS transporter [Qipengyuania qiaonensis]
MLRQPNADPTRSHRQPGEEDGLPMPRRIWAVVAISFGTALFVLDGSVANVALPTIGRELGVSNGVVTNVVTVYQLVLVMALLPFSSMGDRIGHRTLYQIGQLIFLVASALTFFVEDFAMLLGVRAFQALGAGMALSVSAAMLRDIYPSKSLGSGMGINSVVVASAGAIAPTLGGFLVEHLDWRWVFIVGAPAAALSLLVGRSLPDPVRHHDRKPERIGGAWNALTVLLLIGGVQWATHAENWWPGTVATAMGVLSLIFLVRYERARANPVLPIDLLARPVLGLSALAAVAAFMASGSLLIALPFLFEQSFGYPPDQVGLLLLPFPLTLLFVAPAAGWLSDRVDATKLGVVGMTLAIAGLVLLMLMPDNPGAFPIAWRLALTALGFGLFIAPNSRLLIGQAPRARSAAAGGMLSTSRLLGQTLGAALVGVLLAQGLGQGPAPMIAAIVLCVVAVACGLARFNAVRQEPAT